MILTDRPPTVEIEDYSKSLDSDSLGVDLEVSLSRSGSSLSVREEVSGRRIRLHATGRYEGERWLDVRVIRLKYG